MVKEGEREKAGAGRAGEEGVARGAWGAPVLDNRVHGPELGARMMPERTAAHKGTRY